MKRAWINIAVAIGCVGLLLSLLAPAVIKAREDARRTECKYNLKQWGLALHNYHDTYKMFPPYAGGTHENGERLSGRAMLIPMLESSPLWEMIVSSPGQGGDPMMMLEGRFNWEAAPVFLCPSSTIPPQVNQQPHMSYMFNVGDQLDFGNEGGVHDFPNRMKTRGPFGWRSCVTVRDIIDGTSDTIAMAERDLGTPNDSRDVRGRVAKVAATSPAECLKLGSNGRYLNSVAVLSELSGERWASGHPMYSVFLTAVPPNGPSCTASAPPSGKSVGGWFTASSRHPGGCQVLMCDGAVRFINETIDTGDLTATAPLLKEDVHDPNEAGEGRKFMHKPSRYGVWGHLGSMDGLEAW